MNEIHIDNNWKLELSKWGATATNLKNRKYYHCAIGRKSQIRNGKIVDCFVFYWDYNGLHGTIQERITPSYLNDIIEKEIVESKLEMIGL